MPLEGGARLEITLKDMARKMASQSVSAGIYDPELASIAFFNEVGFHNALTGNYVLPRAFMHTTFVMHYEEWRDMLLKSLRDGKRSRQAVSEIGLEMARNINETLIDSPTLFNPNRPATIKKKGFDYPLLETGKLFKAVSFRVEKVQR